MLNHEFNQVLNGFNRTFANATTARGFSGPSKPPSTFIPSANVIFPETVDWRQVGAVNPVKSQGKCAGCYAFAAVSIFPLYIIQVRIPVVIVDEGIL